MATFNPLPRTSSGKLALTLHSVSRPSLWCSLRPQCWDLSLSSLVSRGRTEVKAFPIALRVVSVLTLLRRGYKRMAMFPAGFPYLACNSFTLSRITCPTIPRFLALILSIVSCGVCQ